MPLTSANGSPALYAQSPVPPRPYPTHRAESQSEPLGIRLFAKARVLPSTRRYPSTDKVSVSVDWSSSSRVRMVLSLSTMQLAPKKTNTTIAIILQIFIFFSPPKFVKIDLDEP